MKSKVYLVGAGPGNPGLITVKGRAILREADVVIYDYLVDKAILREAKDDAQLICREELSGRLNNFTIAKAKEGKKVIRLKSGDPAIFGRYAQELRALNKERIEFEVVPGVTAATAASSFSGIPLTEKDAASSCAFVTGREAAKEKSLLNWPALAKSGTIVLYMAVGSLKKIAKELIRAGKNKNTPIGIVKNISLPTQRTVTSTLGEIVKGAKQLKVKPPAIIIIGEVVRLEKELNWFKSSRRILFTGLSKERYFERGSYFHLPLIRIKPLDDYSKFDKKLTIIKQFDWIVFASRYGVEYFFKRLKHLKQDVRTLSGIKIAAVGNSTANKLLDFGLFADLVPKNESSVGLAKEFSAKSGKLNLKSKKIFLPRSDLSDKGLSDAFEKLGAKVTSSVAYCNVMPDDLPELDLSFFNEIIFTSPSTVRNFKKKYKKIPANIKVKYIGKITEKQLKKCKLQG